MTSYSSFVSRVLPFLLGLCFGSGILALLLGSLTLKTPISFLTTSLITSGTKGIFISLLSLLLFFYLNKKIKGETAAYGFLSGAVSSSILLYTSSWTTLSFAYISDSVLSYTALYSLIIFFLCTPFISNRTLIAGSFTALAFLLILFFKETGWLPVYSDDHGSVTYRLSLLKTWFPSIPLYNTEWNAGTDWRDFFATGILNVFFLFYPLIRFMKNIDDAYVIIVPGIIFIITPLSSYIGARVLSLSHTSAALAGFLAVTAHANWYKWGLSYGSMGFVCSSAIFPLFLALAIRTLDHSSKTPIRILAGLIISGSLCIFWSAQGLSMIPLIIFTLVKIKHLFRSKRIMVSGLLLVMLHLPWIILFLNVSKVGSFVSLESSSKMESVYETKEGSQITTSPVVKGKKEAVTKKTVLRTFREHLLKIHPVLYLIGLPALLFIPWNKRYRMPYLATSLWLLFLGTIMVHLKPQLELDRMLVILSLILSIPVGEGLYRLFSSTGKNSLSRYSIGKAVSLSLLLLGFLSVGSIIQKRSWISYHTKNKAFNELALLISENAGSGRTLFSGFVLHDFEGSHIAPLVQLSGSPIMASSPIHNLWWYTDVIPEEYRKRGPAGIEEYLDLYNVTLTIAHERVWKDYFRQSSFRYEEIAIVGRFVVFKRSVPSESYFYSGSGKMLTQNGSGFEIQAETPDVVLRFNYFPFLSVDNCESISPYKVSDSVTLVGLSSCLTDRPVKVKSVSAVRRAFMRDS